MENNAIFKDCEKTWGVWMQCIKTIEECSELIKVLAKIIEGQRTEMFGDQLAEEIADVEVMLNQLIYTFGLNPIMDEARKNTMQKVHDQLRDAHKGGRRFHLEYREIIGFLDEQ